MEDKWIIIIYFMPTICIFSSILIAVIFYNLNYFLDTAKEYWEARTEYLETKIKSENCVIESK